MRAFVTSPSAYGHNRAPLRRRTEAAFLELWRIVMADDVSPQQAADRIRAHVAGDRRVLTVMLARVAKASLVRPTRLDRRAELTLHLALDVGSPRSPRRVSRTRTTNR